MSKKKYRQFSEDFKLEALKLLGSSGKPTSQIERELGISPGLLVNGNKVLSCFRSIKVYNVTLHEKLRR